MKDAEFAALLAGLKEPVRKLTAKQAVEMAHELLALLEVEP